MNTTSENSANAQQQFGRSADVARIYGIKRGTLYNLHRDGKVRSALLRVRGKKSGCRLWDMASIREVIAAHMQKEAA